jgi:hypothetical protein
MNRVIILIVVFVIFLIIYGLYNYFFRKKYYDSPIFPDFSRFKLYNREKKKYCKSEEKCRGIFRDLTGFEFTKVRPAFLKYYTGKNLEIDGFNPLLNIGFEYNGIQHYRYTPYFHKSIEDLYEQQRHDQFKRDVCKKLGIKLITIPYTVKDKDLRNFITMELLRCPALRDRARFPKENAAGCFASRPEPAGT